MYTVYNSDAAVCIRENLKTYNIKNMGQFLEDMLERRQRPLYRILYKGQL